MYKPASSFKVASNIQSLPFADLGEACKGQTKADVDALVEEFCTRFGVKTKSWVYPQVLARIASWTLSRNNDKYCAFELLKNNCSKSPFDMGIYYFSSSGVRALAKQYDKEGAPFCKLVPLIPAAFKKMMGINYSEWDRDKLDLVIHPALWEAMNTDYYPYSTSDLLKFRDIGLTTKSGKHINTVKSPVSAYGLNGLPKEWEVLNNETGELTTIEGPGMLPQLVRMMLCQTWCAHPSNRNKYMILDPKAWDSMPAPLIEDSPFTQEEVSPTLNKLPW